jgi:signal transduction histidine kinase
MKGYMLIIGPLILVVSVLITLNVFFQQSLQMDMAEQFNKQQLLLSGSLAESIKAHIYFLEKDVIHVSTMLSQGKINDAGNFQWLAESALIKKGIVRRSIGILNAQGGIVFYSGDEGILRPVVPEIVLLAGKLEAGDAGMIEAGGYIYVISPAYSGSAPGRIVFESTNINDIADHFVSSIKLGTRGHAWMMNKRGTLIYHPTQPDMVGGNIYSASRACFKCHVSFDLEKKIIEGKAGAYGRHIAATGEDKILAFSAVDMGNISWIIAVSSPYSEVTQVTRQSMRLYSYLIIAIFITTSIIAAALIIFNKKRIKAEEVEKRKDELEKYAVELERQINERTIELISEKDKIAHSEKLASIGRLAAGIAHEIGNPLTSIFSFVQILREMEDDRFKKESLETIYFHINRISGILKQLSGFSRMPGGQCRQCNVNEFIEASINLVQYDKKAKDVSIIKELSPVLPDTSIDGNQLSQVIVNLILNAMDAMPGGGNLTIRSFATERDVVIQFMDEGVGIPKEDLARVFEPFYTTKEKGTGLGLAVSYDIIKKMNGALSVESETGKGSVFTITIPISR